MAPILAEVSSNIKYNEYFSTAEHCKSRSFVNAVFIGPNSQCKLCRHYRSLLLKGVGGKYRTIIFEIRVMF